MPANLAELTAEADRLHAEDPDSFEDGRRDQPSGDFVREAEMLLGEDAHWHQIATVAHALRAEEVEAEE